MKNVIITVLAILVIGLGGFLVYDNFIKEEKETKNTNEVIDDVKETDYDITKAKELVDKFYYGMCNSDTFTMGYTENVKSYLALKNFKDEEMKTFDCVDTYGKENIEEEYDELISIKGIGGYCTGKYIEYSKVNEEYQKLFGSNNSMKKERSGIFLFSYEYNEKLDGFAKFMGIGGCEQETKRIYDVTDAKLNGDLLTVEVATTLFSINVPDYESYKSNLDNYKEHTYDEVSNASFVKEFVSKYKDSMDHYEYTFVKDGNNFVFKSFGQKLS